MNAPTWRPSPGACALITGAAGAGTGLAAGPERTPPGRAPSPEQRAIIVETLHEVDAMLQRLPQRVSDAFILAQLHGMPYKAIGLEIGVSERMVKKYLAQA